MSRLLFLPVLLAAGCWDVAGSTSTGASRQAVTSADPKKDPEGYARNHKWWAKPRTSKELDELITFIIETNAGRNVWFNDHGEKVRTPGFGSLQEYDRPKWMDGNRRACVEVAGPKRWDRQTALAELIKELDRAEFQQGRPKG
jgi:hypothetical protein